MNNDDQKVVWKKSSSNNKQKNTVGNNSSASKNQLDNDTIFDLAKRSADHKSISKKIEKSETITSLQDDIKNLMKGIDRKKDKEMNLNSTSIITKSEREIQQSNTKKESEANSTVTAAAIEAIEKRKKTSSEKENSANLISTTSKEKKSITSIEPIKESIRSSFNSKDNLTKDNILDSQTKKLIEEKDKKKGIEQTYYSDLSTAMGSNEPATVSELLRKARYEKKTKEIFSPRSKRNIFYIIGALLLLGGIFAIVSTVFKKKEKVEFITEKKVSSLVYSDKDTGINVTGAESEKAKQAIRKVIETTIPEGSIHQIYYAGKDELGNIRRLGLKQVFETTGNLPPDLLYENIENNFMHGVYKTDKNHPFIILKAKSYDRAFEGMREWEPTMIDDLSTYFDLPKEAGDRSLLEPGFSEDLIKNKNVRVARFLPRDVDKRGGVFDLFKKSKTNSDENESSLNNSISYLESHLKDFIIKSAQPLYAQITFQQQGGGAVDIGSASSSYVCYQREKECTYKNTVYGKNSDGTLNKDIIINKSGSKAPTDLTNPNIFCSDIINVDDIAIKKGNPLYETAIKDTTGKYTCQSVIDNTPEQNQACFDIATGNKIQNPKDTPAYQKVCFDSYECREFVCQDSQGKPASTRDQGKPGVICGEAAQPIPKDQIESFPRQKICHSYPELLSIQNLNQKSICFDENGKYIEGYSYTDQGSLPKGINCIQPINRDATMCIDQLDKVVFKDPNIPESQYKVCFKTLDNTTELIDEQFQQNYGELQQKAAVIAVELKALSLLLGLVNADGAADTLNDASTFFFQIAYGNIVENEIAEEALGIIRRLDQLLNDIDPNGNLSHDSQGNITAIGRLRNIIDMIKGSFGYKGNLAWVTLGNDFPEGIPIPVGGVIRAGQTMEQVVIPVQQVMTLVGLMDPISVTGQLDLVTQDAISVFQTLNGLPRTGIIDTVTINYINGILSGVGSLYSGAESASIDDYFENLMGLGEYSEDVQSLQILLYAEGYEIDDIDGLFDQQVCAAVIAYQSQNELPQSDEESCTFNIETIESLNILIRTNNYLGTGFTLNGNGFLQGKGLLDGRLGPGAVDFGVNEANADHLKEGDIVLMYTFLDEKTILITRHESVITEIIKRRALNDIFNKS